MTENKKFSLKVIEEGRLSKEEANQIVGGLALGGCCDATYKLTCSGTHLVKECLVYTFCSPDKPTDTGFSDCPCGPDGANTVCTRSYKNKA